MKDNRSTAFIPQAKILRVFELIARLETDGYTIKQLSRFFDQSDRTTHRYLNLLRELQLPLIKEPKGKFRLQIGSLPSRPALFTAAESAILQQLVKTGANKTPLRDAILQKLGMHSEPALGARLYLKGRLAKMAETVANAIRLQQQVALQHYHSANSRQIRNRLVEPFSFGDNFETIHALDLDDNKCKAFKLERCASILNTGKPWKLANLHQKFTVDAFGLSGQHEEWVTLDLSLRAYLLLAEEHPKALPYITVETGESGDQRYFFYGPVLDFKGVARFVLGLAGDVDVVGPRQFKELLIERLQKALQALQKKSTRPTNLTQVVRLPNANSHPV